ncbi:hypothetical protein [Methanosphaera sp. BMS]|uniref:hypothetical protein n=1 Tax=Methanosphaera sp. BMS TaxID=1789762 RepID=UPI000DC1F607|nr:hypothetical protein [Methanosphaera sp. BMS]AWX32220.1 hypothetical protein AW729_03485 [Methanosphaera sp. BMS]
MNEEKIEKEFRKLVNKENMNILYKNKFSVKDYEKILDNIYTSGVIHLKLKESDTALDKIKKIASQYAQIVIDDNTDLQGYYIHNKLFIKDTLPDSLQITTIIHELAHQLYAEIFEQIIKQTLNVHDEYIIQSFIMFMLNNSIENRAATEYISYIIEGRFTPLECQNFIPFLQLLMQLEIDVDHSKQYFIYGHEVSHHIQDILDKIITPDIKDEIKKQFEIDDIEKYNQQLKFEYCDERFSTEETIEIMNEMILFIYDYFLNGDGKITELLENYELITGKKRITL